MIGRKIAASCIEGIGGEATGLIGDENTVLAIGRIGDCSGQGHQIQVKGDPSFQNQTVTCASEFDAVRDAGLLTGDLWAGSEFVGSDYYNFTSSSDFNLAASNFTIDVWLRLDKINTLQILCSRWYHTGLLGNAYFLIVTTDNKLQFACSTDGYNYALILVGDTLLEPNKLYHVAVIRNSTTVELRLNGEVDGSGSLIGAIYSSQILTVAYMLYSGTTPIYRFNGSIRGFRLTLSDIFGSADFTPPVNWQTDYLDNITANTKLLLPMHGDTAFGHTSHDVHDIGIFGEPTIDAVTLGGGKETSCVVFDGTNDYLSIADSESGIESIDFWIYNDTNTRDILKISSSAKVAVDGSGNIALTGMSGWQTLVNGSVGTNIGTASWKHVGLKKNTGSAVTMDGGEIGRSSTYFDGKLANIRMHTNELDYAALWTAGKLYTLEDAYS